MLIVRRKKIKVAVLAAWFFLCAVTIFPQDELMQRGSIPEELLRPRRDEAPRYPIDMVIGALGQGEAPREAYEIAKNAAAAFLAGNMHAAVLSPVNKVFVESCMSTINTIYPHYYRMGSGREEPDGSVSFLVRFVGRERGITGELFVRFEDLRPAPEPELAAVETDASSNDEEEGEHAGQTEQVELIAEPEAEPPPVQKVPAQKIWLFEDLILEESRSREEENSGDRHRFDFSPYERIF